MKKLSLLFIALAFVLTSCSKDDKNYEELSGDLVGTWEAVSLS